MADERVQVEASVPAYPAGERSAGVRSPVPGYEIVEPLGEGGMGVVYRAVQTDLGRPVALKMLTAGGYATEQAKHLFDAEVKAAAAVRHPNVVEVFHADRANNVPFLAMELLPGGSLASQLRDRPFPPPEAARCAAAVARGVAACHAAGVLHLDLKPGNVLLAADGTPKVTDFGLARRFTDQTGVDAVTQGVGTPSYMAPEQVRGGAVGPAADVYGLGAVLYALLTGRPPFPAPTPEEAMRRVLAEDPVSVRVLQSAVPPDLETICGKCLAKEPGRRYESAAAVADDLERYLSGRPILARRAGPIERGRKWVRRNRTAALVMAAQAVTTTAAVVAAVVAVVQRDVAVKESNFARTQSLFQSEVYLQASPAFQADAGMPVRNDLPVREALKYAVPKIEQWLAGQPHHEAVLRYTVGQTFYGLEAYPEAVEQYELALRKRKEAGEPRDEEHFDIVNNLGDAMRAAKHDPAAARNHLETARDWRTDTLGERHPKTLQTLNNLGLLLQDSDPPAALDLLRRAAHGRADVLGETDKETLRSFSNVALLDLDRGKKTTDAATLAEAEQMFRRVLAGRSALGHEKHPQALKAIDGLAETYWWQGRPGDAEPEYRKAVELSAEVLPDAPMTAHRRVLLGEFLVFETGKRESALRALAGGWAHEDRVFAEAERLLLAGYDRLCRPDVPPKDRERAVTQLVELYRHLGRPADAATWEKRMP